MAALQYASTDETTNLSRASRVLLGPCTDQLRDVLRHHVPEQNFQYIIRQNRSKITHLTKPQKELILPRSGHYSGNYFDMDISLLYTLLRNICNIPAHTNGWGNDPNPNNVSLSANIERIRSSRNVVGHSLSYKVSYTEFNDMWSTIRLAVVEIDKYLNNNSKYEKAVDFLKSETMDPEMEKEFEERLHKQMEEETETRKIIKDTKQEVKGRMFQFNLLKIQSMRPTQCQRGKIGLKFSS
ncbi:hypothetical protein FSP39_002798 [Pinctada imbricata]|uniref:DZIP3-like HEPN domain-containing protein n=1 Tax=Pinctada imbricata TaxID=66713 RepID=A0AA88XCJ9_PINIB|nr:hypothetical protein FSP39_002798 [Pinctada imbricata]